MTTNLTHLPHYSSIKPPTTDLTLYGTAPTGLTITNEEVWCKIPTRFAKFFNLCKLKRTQTEPKCYIAKVKILKYKLQANPVSKKVKVQAYVHFMHADRAVDRWVDYNCLIKSGEVLTKHGKICKLNPDSRPQREKKVKVEYKTTTSVTKTLKYDETEELSVVSSSTFTTNEKIEQELHDLTNVKTIQTVVYDGHKLHPHYYSPYPLNELCKSTRDTIYICKKTFHFFTSYKEFCKNHVYHPCQPPGLVIYEDDEHHLQVYQINPSTSDYARQFCQRLALFSKLFIDHKTLFFDNCDEFVFYAAYIRQEFVGYFSKESDIEFNANYNNLSCFMVLPFYQRRGYGSFLASLSDMIAQANSQNLSGPEFPLSSSGRSTYFHYWAWRIHESLNNSKRWKSASPTSSITLDELSALTKIRRSDLKYYFENKPKMIKQMENNVEGDTESLGVNKVFLGEIMQSWMSKPKLLAVEGKLDSYNDTYD